MRASRRDSGELFAGIRGTLAMADGVRAQWDAGELEEDVFGLVVSRSEILGFAEFGGDRHAIEHWGHCDAGGTWTQDGAEHLLAWLQVDVPVGAGSGASPGHEPKRLLPIASTDLGPPRAGALHPAALPLSPLHARRRPAARHDAALVGRFRSLGDRAHCPRMPRARRARERAHLRAARAAAARSRDLT